MARRTHLRLLALVTALWIGWAGWATATAPGPLEVRVVDEAGNPLTAARLVVGGREQITDQTGRAFIRWAGTGTLTVGADGFLDRRLLVAAPMPSPLTVQLKPRLLRGVVADGEGRPLAGARIEAGATEGVSGRDGRFEVRSAEPGEVRIRKPAWRETELVWDGSPGLREVSVEPRVVKAVHVTGQAAGDPARWAELVELTRTTELNGLMLDLKDEWGVVYYETRVETARRAGSVVPTYSLAQLARQAEEEGIYLIGRIVTFQDPIAARAFPEMAVGDRITGGVFSKNGQYFLDPTDRDARTYGLALAEEACSLGVDEIQFDYVRYPDGFGERAIFDGGSDEAVRVEAIRSFLEEAQTRLAPKGCAVAADIFGFITTVVGDGGIGQDWKVVTSVVDVVSPMLYPSHYDPGWFGFDRPVDYPGRVVGRALEDGIGRLSSAVVIRPWLQDFGYTPGQVRAQIDVAESFGLGWMLWNPKSNITVDALRSS